jgi:hypothetical protein
MYIVEEEYDGDGEKVNVTVLHMHTIMIMQVSYPSHFELRTFLPRHGWDHIRFCRELFY